MREIRYNTRTFLNAKNQVVIRVRWNNKKSEVGFSIGMTVDPMKWDPDTQRPIRASTHIVGNDRIPSRVINERIQEFLETIQEVFSEYKLRGSFPTPDDLRELVNEKLGRAKKVAEPENDTPRPKTLLEIFNIFLSEGAKERDWTSTVHYKYEQIWKQLMGCDPEVTLETLDKDKMVELKEWYVRHNYRNRTITKQFRILKSFLRWMKANGYPVLDSAIGYTPHLTVTKKNVTYLTFNELMQFFNHKFSPNQKYLERARDLFCFMAFTSLRYSDLAQLKRPHVTSRGIDLYTKKTSDHLTIPIIDNAQKIIDKYADYQSEDGSLFPVPSAQKLNDYIKLAAKEAGLDREVINTYYIGTKRYDEINKFYDIIGCHDGRRTFVCCSLAFGIPAAVVMSITGHKDYESMKPYIEIANETKRYELDKWNGKEWKIRITELLDKFNEAKLKKVYKYAKKLELAEKNKVWENVENAEDAIS